MSRLMILAAVLTAVARPLWPRADRPRTTRRQSLPSSRSTARAAITTRIARGSSRSKATPRCSEGRAHGPAILPGDAKGSRIIRVLTGSAKPMMPPKDEPRPGRRRDRADRGVDRIGARGPAGPGARPPGADRAQGSLAQRRCGPVVAMDATRDGRWLAVARGAEVGLYTPGSARGPAPDRTLGKFPGKVTALHFTRDGSRLVTASGVAGLGGVAAIWNVADGALDPAVRGPPRHPLRRGALSRRQTARHLRLR